MASNQALRAKFHKGQLVDVIWRQDGSNVIRTVPGRIKQIHRQAADVEFLGGSKKGATVPIRYKDLRALARNQSLTHKPLDKIKEMVSESEKKRREEERKAKNVEKKTEPKTEEKAKKTEPKKPKKEGVPKGHGAYLRVDKIWHFHPTGVMIAKCTNNRMLKKKITMYAYVLIDTEDGEGMRWRTMARFRDGMWEGAESRKVADPTNKPFVLAVASLNDPLLAPPLQALLEDGYLKLAEEASKRKAAADQEARRKKAEAVTEKLLNADPDKLDKLLKLLE